MYVCLIIEMIQLRIMFENQAAVAFTIQDFGQLIDPTQERQYQPRFSPAAHPQMAARYMASSQNARNASRQSLNNQSKFDDEIGLSLMWQFLHCRSIVVEHK